MKYLLSVVTGFILLFIASQVQAKYFTALNGPGVKITQYFTHSGGGITLYISGDVLNQDNCAITNRVHLKGDLPGHKNMVTAALAAFAAGNTIGLHASGCEVIPFWGGGQMTPIISDLWVFK